MTSAPATAANAVVHECYEARCLMGIETGSVGAPAPTLAEAGA